MPVQIVKKLLSAAPAVFFAFNLSALAQVPVEPTDPNDPQFAAKINAYLDYQHRTNRRAEEKVSDERLQAAALRGNIVKTCLHDSESKECLKYRKGQALLVKIGLDNLDSLIEHHKKLDDGSAKPRGPAAASGAKK